MRLILIDAEKLKKTLPLFIREEADAYIDEAEEVEAIPIEWINNYIKNATTPYVFVTDLLEDWEKENKNDR